MANYTGNKITTLDTAATRLDGVEVLSSESYGFGTRLQGLIISTSEVYGYAGGWFATDDDDGNFAGPGGVWQTI